MRAARSKFPVLVLALVLLGCPSTPPEDSDAGATTTDGGAGDGSTSSEAGAGDGSVVIDGGTDDGGTDDGGTDDGGVDAALPGCVAGTTRCTGLVPETCDASGAYVAGAPCDYVCDDGACVGECVPGTTRCEGPSPERCDASGAYQATGPDCPYFCTDGACTGECVPGTTRCLWDGSIERCDGEGTFGYEETCSQACDEGACVCGADYVGDGYDCQPLDFCAPERGGCSPRATCSQTGATPSCSCDPAYTGDGFSCRSAPTVRLTEGFDDVSALAGAGWSLRNSSSPLGSKSWFQGNVTPSFSAQGGAANSFVSADFLSTGSVGTISVWLTTPEIDFGTAATFAFHTRHAQAGTVDRLEVRVCSTGSCDAPGTSPAVDGYETVLLTINPNEWLGVYPTSWTRYQVTNANGIPTSGRGRIAFRYFVTNAGNNAPNGDTIGIDTVTYEAAEPAYPVIVTMTGSSAVDLVLNHQSSITAYGYGTYAFPIRLDSGTPFVVTLPNMPSWLSCTLTNATGTVTNGTVDVGLDCTTQ